MTTIWA